MFHMDRARPLPVADEGRATVEKNTESCEEIYRRSKRTMFLTAKPTTAPGGRKREEVFGTVVRRL